MRTCRLTFGRLSPTIEDRPVTIPPLLPRRLETLMPCLTALLLLFAAVDATPQINPVPRAVLPETELARWDFDKTDDGWIAENQCTISAAQGVLKIHSTGDDPYLHHRIHLAGGDLTLRMRARSHTDGGGEIFWTTDRSPDRSVDKSRSFALTHDGQWHEYFVDFSAPGRLEDLRFDPGMAPGDFEIDWIRLVRRKLHPLEITAVQAQPCGAIFTLTNHGPRRMVVVANGKDDVVPAQGETDVMCPWPFLKVVESITLKVQPKGSDRSLPPVERRVFTYHNVVEVPWIVRSLGDMTLEVAPDGSAARVRREGETVAVLAPLVHCNGKIPMMRLLPPQTQSGGRDSQGSAAQFLRFEGEGVTLELSASGKEIALAITSEKACEGPVVRALGRPSRGNPRRFGVSRQRGCQFLAAGHRELRAPAVRSRSDQGDPAVDVLRDRPRGCGDDLVGHESAAALRHAELFRRKRGSPYVPKSRTKSWSPGFSRSWNNGRERETA